MKRRANGVPRVRKTAKRAKTIAADDENIAEGKEEKGSALPPDFTRLTLAEIQSVGLVINEDGSIIGRRGAVLKRVATPTATIAVKINGVTKRAAVAEMVAAAFKPKPANPHLVLYHVDNDFSNCAVSNLEWRLPPEKQDETITWQVVPDCEEFQASDTGRIFSLKTSACLMESKNAAGYLLVCISGGTVLYPKHGQVPVHRLVCLAFHGKQPSPNHTIDHINRNRSDNRAVNLKWATRKEQGNNRRVPAGLPVQSIDRDGKVLQSYESAKEASEKTGIKLCSIYQNLIRGSKSRRTGEYWRYEPEAKAASERKVMVPLRGERWADIPGATPGLRVSSKGRFAYAETSGLKEPFERGGYHTLWHEINGLAGLWQAHIIVAYVFLPRPPELENRTLLDLRKQATSLRLVVDHLNEERTDNQVDNLEWTTGGDNTVRALGIPVVALSPDDGSVSKRYAAASLAAKEVGCSATQIRNCCLEGKTWRGKTWRFEFELELEKEIDQEAVENDELENLDQNLAQESK